MEKSVTLQKRLPAIDARRGIFILLLNPLWMSLAFREGVILQVLYAIGGSFCCMILLRRIGDRSLLAI